MSKVALLFSGQGAQTVGMGADLAEHFPEAKEIFDQANAVLGYDLASICFRGPEEELTKTEHAQPGIFLVSWVALHMLQERLPTLSFQAAAGLSLGEITALTAAGAFSFEDGLKLVRERGLHMQEACEATQGSMAAVIGLGEEQLAEVCRECDVEIANLNCPGQIVISGEESKVEKATDAAKTKGAKRVVALPVAGAYHSRLMAGAQEKLRGTLAGLTPSELQVPVISNVTAGPYANAAEIPERLVAQVAAPVLWEKSMRYLLENDFTTFVEVGPGTALTGFMKRIDKNAVVFNVADAASLRNAVQGLTS